MKFKKNTAWLRKCFFLTILGFSIFWAFLFFSTEILLELIKKIPGSRIQINGSIGSVQLIDGKLSFLCKNLVLWIGNSQLEVDADQVRFLFSPAAFFKNKEYFFSVHAGNVKLKSSNDPLSNKVLIRLLKSAILNESSVVSEVIVDGLYIDIPLIKDLLDCEHPVKFHFKKNWEDSNSIKKAFSFEFVPNSRICGQGTKYSLVFDERSAFFGGQNFKKLTGQLFETDKSIFYEKFSMKGLTNKKEFFLSVYNSDKENVLLAKGPIDDVFVQAKIDAEPIFQKLFNSSSSASKPLNFKGQFLFKEFLNGYFSVSSDAERPERRINPLAWGYFQLNKEKTNLEVLLKTSAEIGNIKLNTNVDLEDLAMKTNCKITEKLDTKTFLKIYPGNLFIDSKLNPNPETQASSYFSYLPDESELLNHKISGFLEFNRTGIANISIENGFGYSAKASFNRASDFQLRALEVCSQNEKIIEIGDDLVNQELQGFLDFKIIDLLAPRFFKKNFIGSFEKVNLTVKKADLTGVSGFITTDETGNILPIKSANQIKTISGFLDCNFRRGQIDLSDLNIDFSVGRITLPLVRTFVSSNFEISSVYAPLVADNLLINKDNEFFATIDASILVSKRLGQPFSANGNVLLKRSIYKNSYGEQSNLKIPDFLEQLDLKNHSASMDLDLSIRTQKPFEIKTMHLNALLDLDLQFKGLLFGEKIINPTISGNAEILSGNLFILGNSFEIKNGDIKFYESLGSSPFIDVLACGKVKKYELDFHALGCLSNPSIHLQSSPELSEEQIVSLLMSGFDGQDTSLMQFLPGILIKRIEDVVSEDVHTSPKVGRVIRAVTSPARTLKISPCLIDSKLENIGAAISLDIGSKLHASAKKGVHGKDHLSLQMEYLLSDNLSFKVGRGSQGDVEGELEMKFKF